MFGVPLAVCRSPFGGNPIAEKIQRVTHKLLPPEVADALVRLFAWLYPANPIFSHLFTFTVTHRLHMLGEVTSTLQGTKCPASGQWHHKMDCLHGHRFDSLATKRRHDWLVWDERGYRDSARGTVGFCTFRGNRLVP